jgi:3-mercaptopyruvate sulfurtransferase SseA
MFGKEWRDVLGQSRKKKIVVADGEEEAVHAAHLAELLGYENFVVLQGGFEHFKQTILQPQAGSKGLAPERIEVSSFRLKAAAEIATLMKEQKAPKSLERRVKKIVGGCGA